MKVRPITEGDLKMFAPARQKWFRAPPDMENCQDIEVLVTDELIRIPFVADERDVVQFEGTVWLTIWGQGMPPVDLLLLHTYWTPAAARAYDELLADYEPKG